MKKLTFILTVLSALSLKAEARKLYIRAGVGYAAPTAGQTRDVDGYPLNGTTFIYTGSSTTSVIMNVNKASFASGVNANLAIGYSINDHIGVELSSLFGIASTKYTTYVHNIYSNAPEMITAYSQYAKLPIFLIPSLTLQTGNRIRLYMKAGVVLPIKTEMLAEEDAIPTGYYLYPGYLPSTKAVAHFRFNLGLAAATGISIKMNKHLRFFTEANLMSLSLYLKDVTSGSYKTEYKMKANSAASEDGTYSYPFSTIGGSLGLEFNL